MEASAEHLDGVEEPEVPEIIAEIEADLEAFAAGAGLSPESVEESLTDREELLDWHLERMGELDRQMEHNRDVAERRIKMVTGWLDEENGRLARQREWLEGRIRRGLVPPTCEGFQEVFRVKKKSRNLPHGKVGFRSTAPTVDVVDEEKAVAWAEGSCPEAVKVTKKVLKTPIKKGLQVRAGLGVYLPSGETLESDTTGLVLVPGGDSMYIDVVVPEE